MIHFCEVTEDWQQNHLEGQVGEWDVSTSFSSQLAEELSPDIKQATEILSVFIQSQLDADELCEWPNLKMIATRSTGYDHINLGYCEEHGITVCNVPTYGDNTVAEHTFALILSLSRHIHEVVQRTQRGDFELGGLRGFDLRGKTLGVIGTGHIGIHVIKMARGFGMNVIAHDVEEKPFMAELLDFSYVSLEELVRDSHIITLHVPLNPATKHIIDGEQLRTCRDDAILINTARGGLINTKALLDSLEENRIGGAGLDVLEGEEMILSESKLNEKNFSREKLEQLVQNNKLLQRDDVIFTPHMAYNSQEALERILDTTLTNIRGFLDGTPKHPVQA